MTGIRPWLHGKWARAVFLVEGALLRFVRPRHKAGIVLVRLDAIGDFILWLDTAKEYRRIFQNQPITLLAHPAWATFADGLPYWDRVERLDPLELGVAPPWKRWRRLLRIARAGYDVAIHPAYSRIVFQGDSVVRATGARRRIGSTGNTFDLYRRHQSLADTWYTELLPADPAPTHEIDRNAAFLSRLGGAPFAPTGPRLPVTAASSLKTTGPYAVIFPSAAWSPRRWPIERFAEVAARLTAEFGLTPVLCGSPTDAALCAALQQLIGGRAIDWTGKTTIAQLVEVIRHAAVVVSNETSAAHIAAGTGTPAVCILGGGHFGRFLPYPASLPVSSVASVFRAMDCYGCEWSCIHPLSAAGAVRCIEQVSVDAVMDMARRRLAGNPHG